MSALAGFVVLDVKKFAAGRLLWNNRTGADLNVDFDATTRVELSLNDCRIGKAILR